MTEKQETGNLIEKLFQVGAHFGYTKSRRHPTAKKFIFGTKNRIEIFDLEKTEENLKKAKEFVGSVAKEGGQILFLGGKSESASMVKKAAEDIDMPYVTGRWVGGTLTNFDEIKKRVEKLEDLVSQKEKGELAKYTKKERILIDREIEKLEDYFGGLRSMKKIPKALFVVDSKKEHIAVKEAKEVGLPVISISGSDCDFSLIDYPIPANDSSRHSVEFLMNEIVSAYKEGAKKS